MAAAGHGTRLALEGGGQLGAGRLPRRHQAEDQARGQGDGKGEEKHPPVGRRAQAAACLLEGERAEQGGADPGREHEAGGASERSEEKALHQELAHDVAATSPQGQAHRDLPLAGGCARQQEIGDVGARDQENEADHPGEHEKGGRELLTERGQPAKARQDLDLLGQETLAEAGRRAGDLGDLVLVDLTIEHLQAGRGLNDRDARLEASHDVQPHESSILELVPGGSDGGFHGQGDIEVGRRAHLDPVKGRRGDAHDREGVAVELEQVPDDTRISSEPALPVAVVEHGHRARVGLMVVLGTQGAADRRPHPEDVEEVAGDDFPERSLGLTLGFETQGHGKAGQDAREDLVLVAKVPVHGIRERLVGEERALVGARAVEQHQLLGAGHGQEPQEDLIQQGEDRGVGADAQTQRGHHQQGEARILGQHPDGVAQVLDESFHGSSVEPTSRARAGTDRVRRSGRLYAWTLQIGFRPVRLRTISCRRRTKDRPRAKPPGLARLRAAVSSVG